MNNYNPRDLIDQIKARLRGEEFVELVPWYRFYDGEILPMEKGGFLIKGLVEGDKTTDIVNIKELPIKKWTKGYKDWLEKEIEAENSEIVEMREYHTKAKIHF